MLPATTSIPSLVSMRLNSLAISRKSLLPNEVTSRRPNMLHGLNPARSCHPNGGMTRHGGIINRVGVYNCGGRRNVGYFFHEAAMARCALLNADSQTLQARNPSDRLTVNGAPANSSVVTATKIAPSSGSEPLTNATKTSAGLSGMASASSTKITANSEVEVVRKRDKNYSGHGAVRRCHKNCDGLGSGVVRVRAGAASAAFIGLAPARARTEEHQQSRSGGNR